MRILVGFALLVSALVAGCASDDGQSASGNDPGGGGSPVREVNQSLTLTQDEGSALVTLASITESYAGDGGDPDSGNFVAAKFKFEGKAGKYSANPLYVKLKKAGGEVVEPDSFAVPSGESLGGGSDNDIETGETMEGLVAFDAAYEAQSSIVVTDTLGRVIGIWPLSGDKPTAGDGSKKREINKSATSQQRGASAVVTLVSVSESTGSLDRVAAPKSGHFVIVELKFEGKAGDFRLNPRYVKLKKPNGTLIDEGEGNGSYGVPSPEQLSPGGLAPGKTATGKVAFDTPLEPGSQIVITDVSDKATAEFPL